MTEKELERRLVQLEKDVELLKVGKSEEKNWIEAIKGTARDNADYDEIVRLGKELRDSEKPEE